MDDKLKNAESTIQFIQREHERVLHGLHMEIERLQQKCSGKKAQYFLSLPKLTHQRVVLEKLVHVILKLLYLQT